ncbi:T-cell surface glycoprotein CD8 beta chain-like isoform X2 [Tachyglossus aculeatus]|uniref:T-cell surface glycoprotein CD8 beta chain-like isoform X2 n=1 Tax=Tachyglossus aculeatus TaxID=9261 RepID=UPI0018F3D7FD|nr:T-cell surface glycoprotein CD8 beta chain-like isoform X2 [Tachyglossus aculeatus]XP_038608143.1 T-cell surface glycoprotein CD8 beta chain-like isoform X2 [Tachyglossus aculeatus]
MQRCPWLWPWLGLFLLVQVPATPNAPTLQQTPEYVMLLPDSDVTITCEMKHSTETKTIYWFRQSQLPCVDGRKQFVASYSGLGSVTYGNGSMQARVTVSKEQSRNAYTLELRKVKFSDSGVYFCSAIQAPALIFGRGTNLRVVDVLPTTVNPTRKEESPKRRCRRPHKNTPGQNGLSCSTRFMALLVGCLLFLLVSLAATIHLHRSQRRSQLYFAKQFQR